MKKRILMVLLAVALLVTAAAFAVQATEPGTNDSGTTTQHEYLDPATFNCPCSSCKNAPYPNAWTTTLPETVTTSTKATTLPTGHYYIKDQEITTKNQVSFQGETVLILDNSSITCTGSSRMFGANASTVKAHVIGNNGLITGKGGTGEGGLIQVASKGTMNIYGTLTIERLADSTNKSTNGDLIRLYGGIFNMYGGTLNATELANYSSSSAGFGGAVLVDGASSSTYGPGSFNLYGGTVNGTKGAYAGGAIYIKYGSATIDGGTVNGAPENGVNQGGAIYLKGSQTLNVKSGTITGGHAVKGGNIYQHGGTFNLSGGTITKGVAKDNTSTAYQGGNIFQASGTMNITGGTISDGQAEVGGNIDAYSGKINITGTNVVTITGGDSTGNAGNIYCYKDSTYASTITVNNPNATISGGTAAGDGGTVYLIGTLLLQQGTISGGTADNGAAIRSSGTFTMEGGNVNGGTATNGGAVYTAGGTFTQSGGTITGGTATSGGALYVAGGTVTLTSGDIKAGTNATAKNYGSAVYINTGKTFTQTGGTITGGAGYSGGCLYVKGTFNFEDGTITGGKTSFHGGAIYVGADGTVNMSDGEIGNSEVTGTNAQGGVAYVAGQFNMSGGTVTVKNFNKSTAKGFRVQDGEMVMSGNAVIKTPGVRGGDAVDLVATEGTSICTLTLAGNATIASDGTAADISMREYVGQETKVDGNEKLIIAEGWSGNAFVDIEAIENPYGKFLSTDIVAFEPNADIEGDSFNGKLTLDVDSKPTVTARANADAENAVQLFVAGAQIYKKDGDKNVGTWYVDNKAAVDAYRDLTVPAYIKLYTDNALDIETKNTYVNINGKEVNVTGTGELYAFDGSASVTKAGAGKVTGVTPAETVENPLYGYRYVRLGNTTDGFTFHRYTLAITGVTVRPESAGMYYKATIECDPTLRDEIDTYGVAVSVVAMPGAADLAPGANTTALYTSYNNQEDATAFTSGTEFNGVLINNIMKIADDIDEKANDGRAQRNIYANAYVFVNGIKDPIMADEVNGGTTNGIAKNLKSLMHDVDAMFAVDGKLSGTQKDALVAMYDKFQEVFVYAGLEEPWSLPNIKAAYEAANATA